ncbi:3-ketosteroid reductase [Penicillium brasilianum]|uniref:3-ketosteroid reductase n=1 Tax=Penicillium brasilianum TaxID=104259 RepID=A0A1S9RX92_PENBI|nr:3-ketosteroid reductase [Penicillium brasilianum]
MADSKAPREPQELYILVTGANSGLGFSICCRLADEFLSSHHYDDSLTIIFTTRSARKAEDTRRRLEDHLQSSCTSNSSNAARVKFVSESVDLGDLLSARALSRRLLQTIPKLDAIILNAGIGGWSGIGWPEAIWGCCTDLLHQVTWPTYKLAPVGVLTGRQTEKEEEPALGAVFCANVFGHYMLAHNVAPLLKKAKSPNGPGRIVWVSSIEATIKFFDVDDIQALRNKNPYESSKALTDILALTSDQPYTAPWAVDSFLRSNDETEEKNQVTEETTPTTYLSHPGICATSIVPLPLPLVWAMVAAFWIARMLGSPWHTMSTYLGAWSPVFLALSSQGALDAAESPYRQSGGGRVKWGSSANRLGVGSVCSTEIDGWGHGGVVGTPPVEADRKRLRKRGAIDLTGEAKENFEELGRQCWKQMEELRIKWDAILDRAEKDKSAAVAAADTETTQ